MFFILTALTCSISLISFGEELEEALPEELEEALPENSPDEIVEQNPPVAAQREGDSLTNIVLITADDLGVGDVGCYFGKEIVTPRLDALASEGIRFTDFSTPMAEDAASQRAIVTGTRFSQKITSSGLGITLKSHGYKTAFMGQWLIGSIGETPQDGAISPTKCGFDSFYGVVRPADQWSFNPVAGEVYEPLKFYNNQQVIGYNVNPISLSALLGARAAQYVTENKSEPFFLYVSFPAPHVPLADNSAHAYKNVVEALDGAIGKIIDAIELNHLTDKTLIVFLSDNGPNKARAAQSDSAGPFREGKFTCFEGGVRTICIIRQKGKIAPAECSSFASQLDLFPTIAEWTNVPVDKRVKTEGKSLVDILNGKTDKQIYKSFAYYSPEGKIIAVRAADWKLYCPQTYKSVDMSDAVSSSDDLRPFVFKSMNWELYNVKEDPAESRLRNADKPEIINAIRKAIKQ